MLKWGWRCDRGRGESYSIQAFPRQVVPNTRYYLERKYMECLDINVKTEGY